MEQFKKQFIEEANQYVRDIEEALFVLENAKGGHPKETIDTLFRLMHSLKGTGSMFGFNLISELTHHLETAYSLIRENKMELSQALIDASFKAADLIKNLLDSNEDKKYCIEKDKLTQWVQQIISDKIPQPQAPEEMPPAEIPMNKEENPGTEKTYYILFEPNEHILQNGTNPLYLLDELYQLGNCTIFPRLEKIPPFDELNIESCYIYWDIFLSMPEDRNALSDVFLFVEDDSHLDIVELADWDLFTDKHFCNYLKSEEASTKSIQLEELKQLVSSLDPPMDRSAEALIPSIATPAKKTSLEDAQEHSNEVSKKESTISSLRVASVKLDQMMNLVSELITTQARLSLYAQQNTDNELLSISESVEKISRQLRENAFDMSLAPIQNLHTRFKRLVRDLSIELAKQVDFVTEGAETELDKHIIESLADPIMHIIRNCIDHGIESPGERIKMNKPEKGNILLKAYYSGANVHIVVKDDGKGIDPEKLKQKGIQKGLISAQKEYSTEQLLELLFVPGFSTASEVSNISGRGVGLDVVKKKIEELRGEVTVESEPGVGTSFSLIIPLTLSMIDGFLVNVCDTGYIVPMSSIDKIYETTDEQVEHAFNQLLVFDGKQIPFLDLRTEYIESYTSQPGKKNVIVVNYEGKSMGLVVDSIVGEYQTVLKPLGNFFKKQDIFSGASIMGDGSIALVLDTHKAINQLVFNE